MAATPHCIAGVIAYNGTTPINLGDRLRTIPIDTRLS
jgi:hypothetical protein